MDELLSSDAGGSPALLPPDAGLSPTAPLRGTYPFTFTGTAGSYFRIWIVNLFLSLITLGIYSAWAKVRKKRYLYGHTWVADANFEYHGQPFVRSLRGLFLDQSKTDKYRRL